MSIPAPPRMSAIDGGTVDGIDWCIVSAPRYGAINGYARIPEGHPWHGLDYDEIHDLAPGLSVHGCLTFSRDGWIGFDTLHAYDLWPDSDLPHFCADGECTCIHWTQEKVADEARSLARQVAKAGAR